MGFMDEIKKIIHPYDDEDYDYEDEGMRELHVGMAKK